MTEPAESAPAAPASEQRIDDRYTVHEVLGRGGMARVYRVTDRASGREMALKQLAPEPGVAHAVVAALFEREFHTLAELRHPRVTAVYDYGVDPRTGPYYTMELLDGGDLRERTPVPWRELCALIFDVCSSLALLHSRRLVHRDVSPRNIRCTKDGKAKLIDFGAMTPMTAGGAPVVGTPAFTPPETLHRLALDGRADLYSLGATLYYALTGQSPYPARTFADALAAWKTQVVPPSARVPGIPPALDDLVLSLVSIEPALRPASAFDVMQRLAAIAQLENTESADVSRAYLVTPTLVGREKVLSELRAKLLATRMTHGTGVWIEGRAGIGRSRLLDACVLEAKTLGLTVLRATAGGAREPFAIAHGLMRHLLDALPSLAETSGQPLLFTPADADHPTPRLRSFAEPGVEPEQLQQALSRFLLTTSRSHPILIAVDDVQRIDEPSAAVLAELIDKARRGSLSVALTYAADSGGGEPVSVLQRRCERYRLEALTRAETHQLFGSVFGDVANLELLTSEIFDVALGNPRQSMDTAQHLVDEGVIHYVSGAWTLPAQIAPEDLPRNAVAAARARIERLSPQARFLGEAHALAFHELFRDRDYRALLPEASSSEVEHALSELLALEALVWHGATYTLANQIWVAAFSGELDPAEAITRHRALARMYDGQLSGARVHHLFSAGDKEAGLEALLAIHRSYGEQVDHNQLVEENIGKMVWVQEPALEMALRLGRPPRVIAELRRWHVAGSVISGATARSSSAAAWFAQLAHDSGLDDWRADPDTANPGDRLMRALTAASERWNATPEAERVYSIEEALRRLAEYVVFMIAIGGRTNDIELIRDLAEVIEPFAPLTPVLDAIHGNAVALADFQARGRPERARERWLEVLRKLDGATGGELQHIAAIRTAVAYGIGLIEAQLGLESAASWAARLDADPLQKISALHLRRIVRLQQGDWIGADKLRRQAEVLALSKRAPQLFKSLVTTEMTACTKACDLVGMQVAIEELKRMAAQAPGWVPTAISADAAFQLVRGDDAAAQAGFEQAIASCEFDERGHSSSPMTWVNAQAGRAEALLAMNDAEEARARAAAALQICEAHQIQAQAFELVRILALAEVKLGQTRGIERIEELIARQQTLGVTGLLLGLSFEARAQMAIWRGDTVAFEQYSRLCAREYRHGARSPLGKRYERLMNEAGRYGMRAQVALTDFEPMTAVDSSAIDETDLPKLVSRTMTNQRIDERARKALQLICESRSAAAGHLYLQAANDVHWVASQGADQPPGGTTDMVRDYIAQEEERADTMTVMATAGLPDEEDASATLHVTGVTYELLLLTCVVGGRGMVAGVALVSAEKRVRSPKQAQLLTLLASHLLEPGETKALGTGR